MSLIAGLLVALAAATVTWGVAAPTVANLPPSLGSPILLGLDAVSALAGFLAGSAVFRRARRTREHLRLFGALAFGVAGGILGATYAVAITGAYLHTYSAWPQSAIQMALVVLAYPVLGALGFAIGSAGASIFGLCAAGLLGLANPARR
jgi:hypothetical protein